MYTVVKQRLGSRHFFLLFTIKAKRIGQERAGHARTRQGNRANEVVQVFGVPCFYTPEFRAVSMLLCLKSPEFTFSSQSLQPRLVESICSMK